MNPNCEANMDKKRKANSLEPVLGSDQHLSSTTLSHLALIPGQINSDLKELEASQAKTISHEVCIDGWKSPIRSFNPERSSELESGLVKQR